MSRSIIRVDDGLSVHEKIEQMIYATARLFQINDSFFVLFRKGELNMEDDNYRYYYRFHAIGTTSRTLPIPQSTMLAIKEFNSFCEEPTREKFLHLTYTLNQEHYTQCKKQGRIDYFGLEHFDEWRNREYSDYYERERYNEYINIAGMHLLIILLRWLNDTTFEIEVQRHDRDRDFLWQWPKLAILNNRQYFLGMNDIRLQLHAYEHDRRSEEDYYFMNYSTMYDPREKRFYMYATPVFSTERKVERVKIERCFIERYKRKVLVHIKEQRPPFEILSDEILFAINQEPLITVQSTIKDDDDTETDEDDWR